ncbi:MAG TPA: hypothetical protein O0X51_03950 [Methanocorpusculum sp.]|nr:hypothetical protein [Methanocorpusculum sp.]HJK17493.1 hypothetical protein [Methanocorpusculum sp.]HJK28165.1 hypothetical protein [Methanocorpusculum sp.]HJK31454.1 hypothetical protein [Methanocorpusculum sp.]HJK44601.1 hypothetical protein [Methanocorpusculum sp.]
MTDVDEQILEELKGLRQDINIVSDKLTQLNENLATKNAESRDYNKNSLKIAFESLGVNGIVAVLSSFAMYTSAAALLYQLLPNVSGLLLVGAVVLLICIYLRCRAIQKSTENYINELNEKYSA